MSEPPAPLPGLSPEVLAEATAAAAAHPRPKTPGLRITEADPGLVVLYDDVQHHQLAWDYLVDDMPEASLYWLAGHIEPDPPAGGFGSGSEALRQADRRRKLLQNVWRARAAADRRNADRLDYTQRRFTESENKANRRTQLFVGAAGLIGGLIGAGAAILGGWALRSEPLPNPTIQIIQPATTTTEAPSTTTPA